MITRKSVLFALLAVSLSYGDIILLEDFPYSGYSGDGNINTYGIVNVLKTNGIDDVTQIDMETWHARNGEAWMIEEIAANNSRNIFGYYDLDNPNEGYEIFNGLMNDGNANGLDPNTNPNLTQTGVRLTFAENPTTIGFYLASNGAYNNVMFTEQNRNVGNHPQAAIFQDNKDPHSFILAWEDLWLESGSDADFNDMVVKITLANSHSPYDDQYLENRVAKQFLPHPQINPPANVVPESSTFIMLAAGVLFLFAISFCIKVRQVINSAPKRLS
jgi:hypothetical protein